MKRLLFVLFLVAYFKKNEAASFEYQNVTAKEAKPLFLTRYIENGEIEKGKQEALVQHPDMKNVTSYAGYFTINKEYNSNLFFWFFLAKENPETAPVLMWLNGGPGSSSMMAVFNYNGPFKVTINRTLVDREFTPVRDHNVIYLDSPVGTGFSFTDDMHGFPRNEDEIDRDIVNFLTQFFTIFEEFRPNDFYIFGDSYSGKYCATVPRALRLYNEKVEESQRINIKGSALGNGLVDPSKQSKSSEFLYQTGLVDANGRDQITAASKALTHLKELMKMTKDPNIIKMYYSLREMKKKLIKDLTGFEYDQNILITKRQEDKVYYREYIVADHVREAIHVPGMRYLERNDTIIMMLNEDLEKTETAALEDTLEHFKVLIYNGQLDQIAVYPANEEYYLTLNWSGAAAYRLAERKLWHVGYDLAGYWRSSGNMHEVMIRNAGHVASYDQPEWYCDMMTRFTRDVIPPANMTSENKGKKDGVFSVHDLM